MAPKNLEISLPIILALFFAGCLSKGFFILLFTSFSNLFAIILWYASTCFFKTVIPLLLKYETNPFPQPSYLL